MEGLFGLIHESSIRYPGKTFVRYMNHEWSYSEVKSLAESVSKYLLECGVQKGDRVVIFCDNSIHYIAAFFGVLRIGAVAVPVNPLKMMDSILYIVEKCSPKLIIACCSTVGKLDDVRQILCTNIVNIECCGIWSNSALVVNPNEMRDFIIDQSDIALILFTSGTTAYPKGVTLTHGNLMANTEVIVEYLQLTSEDSVLMTLPFTYSYGNSVLLTHAFAGASIVIENSTAFPYKILEGIKKHRVSGFSTVGSYINLMLKCIKNSDTKENFFSSLRYITFAGESTNNDDVRFIAANYPDIKIYVMYGQTEASARLSFFCPELMPGKMGSIGKGLRNVELKVVDEFGADIKPGEVGEIIASGPSIMKCYWEEPGATEEVLRGGWLHTGDSATVDGDGYIYIRGRKSDMIKHMGHRISPVEIENVINSFSCVKESAVIESTLDSEPVIKAYVVLEKECSVDEIKKYTCSKLHAYMRPQVFEIIEQLPRTDTGKIRRSALRRSRCAE